MRTLVVEDDPETRYYLEKVLTLRGHQVNACGDAESAWTLFQASPFQLVLVDWMLPGKSGLDLCHEIRLLKSKVPPLLFVCSARRNPEDLQQILKSGADDYLAKPLDHDVFLLRLALAEQQVRARLQLYQNVTAADGEASSAGNAVGPDGPASSVTAGGSTRDSEPRALATVFRAPSMLRLCSIADAAAKSDCSLLILGESGSGKEVLADYIHRQSPRKSGPMIKVNCAALPEHLLESELFGHEKGAFTGADRRNIGRFERASGGTLFLDEIGDLPSHVQVKLLRAIQNKTIERLGSATPIPVDFRLISATHQNLHAAVVAGKFREDLFYRINVVPLVVPPLRERFADVRPLLQHYLKVSAPHRPRLTFSEDAYECLEHYGWPGNIRQLRNAVEYALVVCSGDVIGIDHLPVDIQHGAVPAFLPAHASGAHALSGRTSGAHVSGARSSGVHAAINAEGFKEALNEREAELIRKCIEIHHWNIARAAKELKMSRSTMYNRLKSYGIRRF